MAIPTLTTYYCFWPDGNDINGGGYTTSIAGGTDFTQTNTAYLSMSSISHVGLETTITVGANVCTTSCLGNMVHVYLSGTASLTLGWYVVTTVPAVNMLGLDRAISTVNGASISACLGGALRAPTNLFLNNAVVPGTKVWFKSGNYSATSCQIATTTAHGTSSAWVYVSGYVSTIGDVPKGSARPVIYFNTYGFREGNKWWVENMNFMYSTTLTGCGPSVMSSTNYYFNVKSTNSFATTTANAFQGDGSVFMACEAICSSGIGVNNIGSIGNCIYHSYIHDCGLAGVSPGATTTVGRNGVVANCIIANCKIGIQPNVSTLILHNTIYNSTQLSATGIAYYIASDTTAHIVVMGNIIQGMSRGVYSFATYLSHYMDYNCLASNTVNYTNVIAGLHDVLADPAMVSPTTGDFTILTSSAAFNTGLSGVNIELSGSTSWNIGADQGTHVPGAGSGSAFEYCFVNAGG